jgi:Snf7
MGNMFGKEKPLKEVLRENKRMINRAVRELDREKAALEREEKRLTMEIKKAARQQQMSSVKIMAKVRTFYRVNDTCLRASSSHNHFSLYRIWFEHDNTLPSLLKCEVTCKDVLSSCKLSKVIKPWLKPWPIQPRQW